MDTSSKIRQRLTEDRVLGLRSAGSAPMMRDIAGDRTNRSGPVTTEESTMRFAVNRRVIIATAASGVLILGAGGMAGAALGVGGSDDPAPTVESTIVDTTTPTVGAPGTSDDDDIDDLDDDDMDDDSDETGDDESDETETSEVDDDDMYDDDGGETDDDESDDLDDEMDDDESDDEMDDETETSEVEDD
jgi:hypothetical protein